MSIKENIERLTDKIKSSGNRIDEKSSDKFIKELIKAKRVFVAGAGRSGFAAKAFAMRLMHLGLTVYAVGESTTPAINKKDILVAVSGSGKTTTTLDIVKAAKEKKKARIALITYTKNSPIGKIADVVIELEGTAPPKKYKDYYVRQVMGEQEPIAPLGTLFELTSMIFLDSVTIELMKIQKKDEKSMKKYHTNLE